MRSKYPSILKLKCIFYFKIIQIRKNQGSDFIECKTLEDIYLLNGNQFFSETSLCNNFPLTSSNLILYNIQGYWTINIYL